MAENVVEQIFSGLKEKSRQFYPDHGECKAIRLVGHTPKSDHYIYDAVLEFTMHHVRISCKVYRAKGAKENSKLLARREYENLSYAYEALERHDLTGAPRPLGDFSEFAAVVAEKALGLPLQSIIMKAALLPGYADHPALKRAAVATGEWLRSFHKALGDGTVPLDPNAILDDLEVVCTSCKSEGLEDGDIQLILTGAKQSLSRVKRTAAASAVLHEFTPLNVVLSDDQVFVSDFAKMADRGMALLDVAHFMAAIEALEKYPFCNREITSTIQEDFLVAYGISNSERAVVRVLKMRELLRMFAAGRNVKETAVRKKVMWANVMKKFIHQAANRTLSNAA